MINKDEIHDCILLNDDLPTGYSVEILSCTRSKYTYMHGYTTPYKVLCPNGVQYTDSVDLFEPIQIGTYKPVNKG